MKRIKLLTPLFVGISSIIPTTTLLTSCSKSQDQLVNELYETTVEEFIEFSKHPHPSYGLDEARCYLINKLNSWGYQVMKDNYGNIWFDIPATGGLENYPKLILQAHMDMVCEGFEGEETHKGVDLVKDKDENNRPVLHSVDYKTSIGADDGIGIAMIMAVAKNKFNHGPIRCIMTADEEDGLKGAAKLSYAALDSDYLLNLDGEGEESREYMIQRGCAGLSQYLYNWKQTGATKPALSNHFTVSISGFYGDHFNHEVCYKSDGAHLKGSADWFLIDVLSNILSKDTDNKIELIEFNHIVDGKETSYANNDLTKSANLIFATNVAKSVVEKAIDEVYAEFKAKYNLEDWTKIKKPIVEEGTNDVCINAENSDKIINFFAKLPRSVDENKWEGTTAEEKAKCNYPNMNTCFTKVAIKDGSFSAVTRGAVGTNDFSNDWYRANIDGWKQLFPNNNITISKNYLPWDATGKTKMIEMATEGFRKEGVEPAIDRTRGGLEPSYFCKMRTNMQQACIGPRIDNIHDVKETVYLDTLPNTIKCMLYVINNMNKFESK